MKKNALKQFLYNLSLFAGCLFFVLSLATSELFVTLIALGSSLIALTFYRKDHPRVNKNYRELMAERRKQKRSKNSGG